MKKVIDYKVLLDYKDNFSTVSKRLVKNGWQPFGGIAICQYGNGTKMSQAFVKYEEPKESDFV